MKCLLATILSLIAPLAFCACTKSNTWFCGFEDGISGAEVTVGALNTSTHGSPGFVWDIVHGSSGLNFTNAAQRDVGGVAVVCHENVPTTGAMGLRGSNGTNQYCRLTFPTPKPSATAFVWFYWTLPVTSNSNTDVFAIDSFPINDLASVQLVAVPESGYFRFQFETFGDPGALPITGLQASNWVGLSVAYKINGTNRFRLYDANTNLLGEMLEAYASTNTCSSVKVSGSYSVASGPAVPIGLYPFYQDGLRVDASDNPEWPLLPNSPPPMTPGSHVVSGAVNLNGGVALK